MSTEVPVPQLGESVTEGIITRWLVAEGDHVETDQPLFELSSDKVDTEVPSPVAGVVTEIRVEADAEVEVGTVVAVIGSADEAPAPAEDGDAPPQADEQPDEGAEEADQPEPAAVQQEQAEPAAAAQEQPAPAPARTAEQPTATPEAGGDGRVTSPLVRRLLREHGLDAASVEGSGPGGRITREDVERAAEGAPAEAAPAGRDEPTPSQPDAEPTPSQPDAEPAPSAPSPVSRTTGLRARTEKISRIRQRIAERMMESQAGAAQLTTIQEADCTRLMQSRARARDEFRRREGVSLSPFAMLCRAAILAMPDHPSVNCHPDFDAGEVTYYDSVNLGIAVDTERGLIVPNIKSADDLSQAGLTRAIAEAAGKARGEQGHKLEMDDITGGTFTMTNTGSRGVLLDTPILNPPEVAILATGAIQRRPVVVDDDAGSPSIAVRHMVYLCLTYDHRMLDGADAARFVGDVKQVIETHDWDAELGLR